jgi:hypothetical protein
LHFLTYKNDLPITIKASLELTILAHDIHVIAHINFDKSSTSTNLALHDKSKMCLAKKATLNLDKTKINNLYQVPHQTHIISWVLELNAQ